MVLEFVAKGECVDSAESYDLSSSAHLIEKIYEVA